MVDLKMVKVTWMDIVDHVDDSGYSLKVAKGLTAAMEENTLGWLISKEDHFIKVGNDYSNIDDIFRKVVVIPISCVSEIVYLKNDKKYKGLELK